MGSKYSYAELVARWEAMTPDRRFQVMADLWPRLPAALQVAFLSLIYAVLSFPPNNAESPDRADTL